MRALFLWMLCASSTVFSADLTPAAPQPAMALIDTSFERLHVGLDLSDMVRAGNGLVINMIIANDEQARVDSTIASLVARLPKGLLTRSLRKGLRRAAQTHDMDLQQALLVAEPRAELFAKVRDSADLQRGLLLRFGTNLKRGNSYPIAITPDFRQLRISLDVELLERRNRTFRRISRQTVTVISAPASVHLGALAQDAWVENDGALMAQVIEDAVLRACTLALAPPLVEPPVGPRETVDLITALAGERYDGRVVDRQDDFVVIARPKGDLLVVPALRVLSAHGQ